jgi:release factor glutamine methyltransferase
MITVRSALEQGTRILEEGGIAVPRLTSEVLLCHALGQEKTYLYSHPDSPLTKLAWIHFGRYLNERLHGKPTQYITKRQEFYGREFRVTPDVLIPRPETEHVVETALRYISPGSRVADIGCGSGAIAVSLSLERDIPVRATDISPRAIAVARDNAGRLGARVAFAVADVLDAFRPRSLDLIVSNPPYVALDEKPSMQREVRDFEPEVALYGGASGNEIYRRLIEGAERVLVPGGRIVFELGWRSLEPVRTMLGPHWSEIDAAADLAGIPRALTARYDE